MRKQISLSPVSCLSDENDMFGVPGHMGTAHDAPCGTGKAEWLLYFTASSESILTKTVIKKLHIGSFLIAAVKG